MSAIQQVLASLGGIPWAGNLSTGAYVGAFVIATQDTQPFHMELNEAGTVMYVVGITSNKIYQYNLSTPFLVTSATYASKASPILTGYAGMSYPYSFCFSADGTKVFICGSGSGGTTGIIRQWNLSTAWDISTATDASVTYSPPQISTSKALIGSSLSPDGKYLYLGNNTDSTVYQYTMSTPFNLATISYTSKSYSVTGQTTSMYGIAISDNGKSLYIKSYNDSNVYQYDLSTAWDISTASYSSKSLSIGGLGLNLNKGGTNIYIAESGVTDEIRQYSLGN